MFGELRNDLNQRYLLQYDNPGILMNVERTYLTFLKVK